MPDTLRCETDFNIQKKRRSSALMRQGGARQRLENTLSTTPGDPLVRPGSCLVEADQNRFEKLLLRSNGKPFVFSDGDFRSLHFEGKYVQSEMSLTAPCELALSYTRVMMRFRLFTPAPRHMLMIGLGGGSLAKYCYRYLPSARITVVEIDSDVIALRNQFLIPQDDGRFRVIHADGANYVALAPQDVDVLILDGFNACGQPAELSSTQFYETCRRLLSPNGVLVANLSGSDPDLPTLIARLRREFKDQIWVSDVPDSTNCVVFAANSAQMSVAMKSSLSGCHPICKST